MNVSVREERGRTCVEVVVLCAPGDAGARRLVARIRSLGERVSGYPPERRWERRLVDVDEVLLVEVVSGTVTLRLADGSSLVSPMRLFQVEAALAEHDFIRVSRQAIVNFRAVRVIRPEFNGRLELELTGGPPVLVTRMYAPDIRRKLGMGGCHED